MVWEEGHFEKHDLPGITLDRSKQKDSPNVLDKTLCYLAGPIDEALDDGKAWRIDFKNKIEKKGIGILFLDPTNKLGDLAGEIGKEKEYHKMLKREHRWQEAHDYMHKVGRHDLRQVDMSDFMIAKVDVNIHMCGTYHEMVFADLEHKPVLMIIEGGKEKAPSWLFAFYDYKLMFDSDDECVEYLNQINEGKIDIDDRWVLIRKYLKM